MGFCPFHGGDQQVFHQVRQFSLDDLEYAFEFSEKEQVLLQRAFDNQEKGGMFHVLKQTGPSGQGGRSQLSKSNGVRVAHQGHLPLAGAVKGIYDTLKALRDGKAVWLCSTDSGSSTQK